MNTNTENEQKILNELLVADVDAETVQDDHSVRLLLNAFGELLVDFRTTMECERKNADRAMALAVCSHVFEQIPATGIVECFPERGMRITHERNFHQRGGGSSFVPTMSSIVYPLRICDASCSMRELTGRLEIRDYHTASWERIFPDECDFDFWTLNHSLWQRIVSGPRTGSLFFSQTPEHRFPLHFERCDIRSCETARTTLTKFVHCPEQEMFFRFTPNVKEEFLDAARKAARDDSLCFVWDLAEGAAVENPKLRINCLAVEDAGVAETFVLQRNAHDRSFAFPRMNHAVRSVRQVFNEDRSIEYQPLAGSSFASNRGPEWFLNGSNTEELILRFQDGADVPPRIVVDVDAIRIQPFSKPVELKSSEGELELKFRVEPTVPLNMQKSIVGLDELLLSGNVGPFSFAELNADSLKRRIDMDQYQGNSVPAIKTALSTLHEVRQEYIDRDRLPVDRTNHRREKPLPFRGRKITLFFKETNERIRPWQFLLSSLLNRLFFLWTSPEMFSFTETVIHPEPNSHSWIIY